jgi:hypothetical protein
MPFVWYADSCAAVQAIKRADIQFPDFVSPLARDWVLAALVMDANKRASVPALLDHPWILTHGRRSAQASQSHSPAREGGAAAANSSRAVLPRRMQCERDGAAKVLLPASSPSFVRTADFPALCCVCLK